MLIAEDISRRPGLAKIVYNIDIYYKQDKKVIDSYSQMFMILLAFANDLNIDEYTIHWNGIAATEAKKIILDLSCQEINALIRLSVVADYWT